jgi:YfiH family protein
MVLSPNLSQFPWLVHGFGGRDSTYPDGIATLKQIHSAVVVEAEGHPGDRFAEGDALITGEPGCIVGVRTADCVPILIADSRTRAVAAVHAGWRGCAAGILGVAVRRMADRFGSLPEDLHAAIGPAIGGCCYEVGPEVAHRFGTWNPDLKHAAGAVKIDLADLNARQLTGIGVPDVWRSNLCTYCEADRFWSFRRDKDAAGRMISYIGALPARL